MKLVVGIKRGLHLFYKYRQKVIEKKLIGYSLTRCPIQQRKQNPNLINYKMLFPQLEATGIVMMT